MFSSQKVIGLQEKRSQGQKRNRMATVFIRRKGIKKIELGQADKELVLWEKILCKSKEIKIKEEGTKLMLSKDDKILNSAADVFKRGKEEENLRK